MKSSTKTTPKNTSQNHRALARALEQDFKLNRVPVLIDNDDDVMRTLVHSYAAQSREKVFELDGRQFDCVDDLVIQEYIDLNNQDQPMTPVEYDDLRSDAQVLTITRLPEVIEKAIDYAESHPTQSPVLFFDDLDCGNPDIVITVFEAAIRRHFGAIHLPCNLKIAVVAHNETVLDTMNPRYRGRFATHTIMTNRSQLLVSS